MFTWLPVCQCLQRGANDSQMVQLLPLPPIISCFNKIQNGSVFLVPAYPGCPGKKAIKRVWWYDDATATTNTTPTTTILWPFPWDYLGEPAPEETFTHSHLSWSSIILSFQHDLNRGKVNQQDKHLGQRSFSSKIIVWIYRLRHRHIGQITVLPGMVGKN